MEISGILRHVGQGVVDLVVDDAEIVGIAVLDLDAGSFSERHLPVTIEGAPGIDADCERTYLRKPVPAAAKEIAQGTLHRRVGLIVPPDTKNEVAPAQIC